MTTEDNNREDYRHPMGLIAMPPLTYHPSNGTESSGFLSRNFPNPQAYTYTITAPVTQEDLRDFLLSLKDTYKSSKTPLTTEELAKAILVEFQVRKKGDYV